ncbi:unnamed protein product [Durusdinium trenchii]|uniref:Uncharacterized protein n=1 Tax=Durusdinium trenchii TaxID=1381693 RepID=A0ABP0QXW4_9DINO
MVWQSCYAVLVWSLCISSKAQTVSWSTTVGTELYDYSRAVVSNSQGEIFIAGASRGQMAENGTWDEIDTTMDAWVMKFSSDGNLLWTYQAGATGDDTGNALRVTEDGGANHVLLATYAAVEISVIWLDMTTGAVVQRADVATPSHTYPYAMTTDNAAQIYVCGWTGGDFSTYGQTNLGDGDIFVMKLNDTTGAVSFISLQGSSALERAPELVVDQSDNIFLVGYTGGSLNGQNAGSNDIFVMKLDPYGDRLWTWQTGTAQDDRGHSIQLDTTGNIFVGGYTAGSLFATSQGYNDLFLLKLVDNGVSRTVAWSLQTGTSGTDYSQATLQLNTGMLLFGGYMDAYVWEGHPTEGDYDLALMQVDAASGELNWTMRWGSAGFDVLLCTHLDGFGNLLATGYTNGNLEGTFQGRA